MKSNLLFSISLLSYHIVIYAYYTCSWNAYPYNFQFELSHDKNPTYPQRSSSRTSGKRKPIGKLAEDQVENDNNNRDRHMANNNTWLLKYIPSSMLGKWTCSKLDVSALGFTFSTTSQHTLQHNRNILARRLKRSTSHNNSSDVHKTQ